MMAAGDTFRAAASAQLKIWGERAQCDVIAHEEGADPAAVVFDALKAAKARGIDVLFIDTAGRLHNKVNLMNELGKIDRIIKREIPEAPHEVFLVLDATTGQNAITQAKVFTETTKITGVVLTKLDGTAKGGVVVAIREELGLPVKWIGIGEGIMDFRPFEPEKFVDAFKDKVEDTRALSVRSSCVCPVNHEKSATPAFLPASPHYITLRGLHFYVCGYCQYHYNTDWRFCGAPASQGAARVCFRCHDERPWSVYNLHRYPGDDRGRVYSGFDFIYYCGYRHR